jgi:hypothetical protein
VRGGADLPELAERRRVAGQPAGRPPEQILVERTGAGVDVASDEVAVERLEVAGRERDALQRRPLEVCDLRSEARDDAVGIGLAQSLRPRPVFHVDLAQGVAGRPARELLQLDPDHRLAFWGATLVDGRGLADDDRRLGRQQPAVGLVDRTGDAVQAGCHVQQGRAREPLGVR